MDPIEDYLAFKPITVEFSPVMSGATSRYLLLLLLFLGISEAASFPDKDEESEEDSVAYGALSPSVQERLINSKSEPVLEPYGALSPSVQSRLSKAENSAGKSVSVRLHLHDHTHF